MTTPSKSDTMGIFNKENLMQAKQDDGMEMAIPMMKQPFITIVKNDKHNRVEVHLRGHFDSPQESTQQLTELFQLAEMYPTVLVFINSGGGRADLLMELHNALLKFQTRITVATSDAASAGFMLWASGDVRVVCEHAELMIHREQSGYINKTDQMIDRIEFVKRRFEKIFTSFCEDVLTPEEVERARLTEVWFTGEDMIKRGKAISWEQFHILDTTPYNQFSMIEREGEMYIQQGDFLLPVNIEVDESKMYTIYDVLYDIPAKRNMMDALNDMFEEDDESEDEPQDVDAFDPDDALTEEIAREILRDEFGKGQYRIYRNGKAKVIKAIAFGEEWPVMVIPHNFEDHTFDDLLDEIDRVKSIINLA